MKIFGVELKFNGFDIFHKGNFDPADKADSVHTHTKSQISDFPTSMPANGGSADTSKHILGDDTRSINSEPSVYMNGGSRYAGRAGYQTEFKYVSTIGVGSFLNGSYCFLETKIPWSDPSGGYPIQIAYGSGRPCWRVGVSTTAWSAWSGLSDDGDADTVDGKHASDFALSSHGHAISEITNLQTTLDGKVDEGSKITLPAGTTTEASLNIPHGAAPTTPVNGDIWTTTAAPYVRLNGTTRTIYHSGNAGTAALSTVTQAEAEAGTATTVRGWTAQRIAQAIAKLQSVKSVNGSTGDVTVTVPTKMSQLENDIGAGGGIKITTSTVAPASPSPGDFWYKEV